MWIVYLIIAVLIAVILVYGFNYFLYRRLMSKAILPKLPKETQAQYVKRKEHDQRFGK